HRASVLSSTTLMPTGKAFEDAVLRAKSTPSLSIGIHLMLVGGRPVSPPDTIPSLMGQGGSFLHDLPSFLARIDDDRTDLDQLELELRDQIVKVKAAGIEPTHVDSHKHTHVHPLIFTVIAPLVKGFGIPFVRMPFETDYTIPDFVKSAPGPDRVTAASVLK